MTLHHFQHLSQWAAWELVKSKRLPEITVVPWWRPQAIQIKSVLQTFRRQWAQVYAVAPLLPCTIGSAKRVLDNVY